MKHPSIASKCGDGWKDGPLPAGTYGWGGVVPHDSVLPGLKLSTEGGFLFADFCGDHVRVVGHDQPVSLHPNDVRKYNNSLMLPKLPHEERVPLVVPEQEGATSHAVIPPSK